MKRVRVAPEGVDEQTTTQVSSAPTTSEARILPVSGDEDEVETKQRHGSGKSHRRRKPATASVSAAVATLTTQPPTMSSSSLSSSSSFVMVKIRKLRCRHLASKDHVDMVSEHSCDPYCVFSLHREGLECSPVVARRRAVASRRTEFQLATHNPTFPDFQMTCVCACVRH